MAQTTTTIPSANDVEAMVSGQRRDWEKMRDELRPAVDAFQRIESLIANFDRISTSSSSSQGQRRTRSSRSGTRMDEFVKLAGRSEGVTPTEAAHQMEGIDPDKPNYLYSLAKKALDAGLVRKENKRYYAVTDESPAEDEGKDSAKDETEAKAA